MKNPRPPKIRVKVITNQSHQSHGLDVPVCHISKTKLKWFMNYHPEMESPR